MLRCFVMSGEGRRAMGALRRIVQALRIASRASERTVGMSAAQVFVLRQIALAGTCSIGELAGRTLTHPSSVSVVVSRLVARGLAQRRDAADDRRRADVSCTAAGLACLGERPPLVQDRLIEALAQMDPGELAALAHGLDLLAASVSDGADGGPGEMFFEGDDLGDQTPGGGDASEGGGS